MLEPMKRKPMRPDAKMKRSLGRVKELYPENKNFNLSGKIGNDMSFGPFLRNTKQGD